MLLVMNDAVSQAGSDSQAPYLARVDFLVELAPITRLIAEMVTKA